MKIILIMATTIDVKISKNSNHFVDWTSKEDKALFKETTNRAGVVIMGSTTYDTIGHPLPGRKNIVLTMDKTRKSTQKNLVFTQKQPKAILKSLEEEGFSEVVLAGGATINTLFAKENLIDEIILTVEPILFGAGVSIFNEKVETNFVLYKTKNINKDTILLHYKKE